MKVTVPTKITSLKCAFTKQIRKFEHKVTSLSFLAETKKFTSKKALKLVDSSTFFLPFVNFRFYNFNFDVKNFSLLIFSFPLLYTSTDTFTKRKKKK